MLLYDTPLKIDIRPRAVSIFSDPVLSGHLYEAASYSSPEGGRYIQVQLYIDFACSYSALQKYQSFMAKEFTCKGIIVHINSKEINSYQDIYAYHQLFYSLDCFCIEIVNKKKRRELQLFTISHNSI